MQIALIALEGFNEIDTFVAFSLLNRVRQPGWEVAIAGAAPRVTSMNGLTIEIQQPLGFARAADAVLLGSGRQTLAQSQNAELLEHLRFDAKRQLIGSQCSGVLILRALGLIENLPVCTDAKTRERLIGQGVEVLKRPFVAHGRIAMAGGCLASQYLASWVIQRLCGEAVAREALLQIAPSGEEARFVRRALAAIGQA